MTAAKTLEYRRLIGRVQIDQLPDGGSHITIATRRKRISSIAASAVEVCAMGDIVTILLSPILFPLTIVFLLLFASSRPRAEIIWTNAHLELKLTPDLGPGWVTEINQYDAGKVIAFRRNQFCKAIYLRVTGKIDCDLLGDLDSEELQVLATELENASQRLLALKSEPPT